MNLIQMWNGMMRKKFRFRFNGGAQCIETSSWSACSMEFANMNFVRWRGSQDHSSNVWNDITMYIKSRPCFSNWELCSTITAKLFPQQSVYGSLCIFVLEQSCILFLPTKAQILPESLFCDSLNPCSSLMKIEWLRTLGGCVSLNNNRWLMKVYDEYGLYGWDEQVAFAWKIWKPKIETIVLEGP